MILADLRFDPKKALGWRYGPLDGLNCVLRCIEVVLQANGYTTDEICSALAQPIDPCGIVPSSAFRGGRLDWSHQADGRSHWDRMVSLVRAGEPCILMPDRYYWPGDEFQNGHHFRDHMVLVLGVQKGVLEVLDSDLGDPKVGCYRRIAVSTEVVIGARSFARISLEKVPETRATLVASLLRPSEINLSRALDSMREFAIKWSRMGIGGPTARALHIAVLGRIQPSAFLISKIAVRHFKNIADSSAAIARTARLLGIGLIDSHVAGGDRPRDISRYSSLVDVYEELLDQLDQLAHRIRREIGTNDELLIETKRASFVDFLERVRLACYAGE